MVAWPAAAGDHHTNFHCPPTLSTGRSVRRTSTTTAREGDQNMGRTCSLGALTGPKPSGRTLATRRAFYIVWEGKWKGGGGPLEMAAAQMLDSFLSTTFNLLFPTKIVVWWSVPNRDKISLSLFRVCVCVCMDVQSTFLQGLLCDRDVHYCSLHEASTCFFLLAAFFFNISCREHYASLEYTTKETLLFLRGKITTENQIVRKRSRRIHRPQPDRAAPIFWIRTTTTEHNIGMSPWLLFGYRAGIKNPRCSQPKKRQPMTSSNNVPIVALLFVPWRRFGSIK